MLTRRELAEKELALPEGAGVRGVVLRTTSGSSAGRPIVLVRRIIDFATPVYAPVKRMLVGFGPMSQQVSNMAAGLYSANIEKKQLLFLDVSDLGPHLERLITEFDPDCVRVAPSFLFRMLEALKGGRRFPGVSTIAYAGEVLSAEKQELLAERFPCGRVVPSYSAAEVGPIGVVCGHLPANHYHPAEGVAVDIVNVDERGVGELLVSKSISPSSRVERYAVGDSVRLMERACPCGEPLTFEFVGRTQHEYLKLVGAVLRIEEFERVARELSSYIGDYRALAREAGEGVERRGAIELQVIPTAGLRLHDAPEEFLAREFSRRIFLTATKTLAQLVQDGAFLPLRVVLRDAFPYEHKTIRLRFARD